MSHLNRFFSMASFATFAFVFFFSAASFAADEKKDAEVASEEKVVVASASDTDAKTEDKTTRSPETKEARANITKSAGGVVVEKLPSFGGKKSSSAAPKKDVPGKLAVSEVCKTKYAKDGASSTETASATDDDEGLQSSLDSAFAKGNIFLVLLIVFFAGLGTALTPCVYPLIPITLSIFGARQASTKMEGFMLSSSYVGGMIALYTVLGTTFAALGRMNGSALQSPFITIGIALFCIAMAASMFGAFDMALPQSLQQKLNTVGGKGYGGAFLMGLVAGIIAAPCTGPILSSILVIIAKEGNVAQGGGLMFVYALGMGLPFLLLGTFSTLISRLPKSGNWMDVLKSVFGILMLVAGVYFLWPLSDNISGIFEKLASYGLVAAIIAVVVGLSIGALQLSFNNSSAVEKVRKAFGILFTTLGLLTLIAWISHTPAPDSSTAKKAGSEVHFVQIGSDEGGLAKYDALLKEAASECKPVMVDFFAEWCAACKELDKFTYPDVSVAKESGRFMNIKIDATSEGEAPDALQERYGIVGLPTVLFFNGSGQLQTKPRVVGFVTPERYLPLMKLVR
ncbi:MAG: thioredoxin fold domain-containing protein [Deltaproteobacteria bacterium]|nr:thioredoxin fold domain-containing protein [Deltaproteobacteria bacterium]